MEIGTILSAATLLLLALNFAFGRTDKGAGKVDALQQRLSAEIEKVKDDQHQNALAMKDLEARLRDHIGGGYATKADIHELKQVIAGFQALFEPIANQLTVKGVRS